MKKLASICTITLTLSAISEHSVRIITQGSAIRPEQEEACKKELATVIEKYAPHKNPITIEIVPVFKDSKQLLQDAYTDINGFKIDHADTQQVTNAGGNPTYGEATTHAVDELKQKLSLSSKDMVVDLGCGVGRLLTQFHLDTDAHCIGYELSKTRIDNAKKAKSQYEKIVREQAHTLEPELRKRITQQNRLLDFRHGDIVKINWSDALETLKRGGRLIVWICSTCFSHELQNKLAENFIKLALDAKKQNMSPASDIIILTLKMFPENKSFEDVFYLHDKLALDMTWSNGVTVYRYQLKK
jgi:SAM-dependent methyltransferase